MKFVRFRANGRAGFGVLSEEGEVRVYEGDMFHQARPTGTVLALDRVKLLPPSDAFAMIALWNNSRSQITKLGRETPQEALYFLKPRASFATHGDPILYPRGLSERVVLEGELGIVIGRRTRGVDAGEARGAIFGYTVVNDVTAQDVVKRDSSFPQYTRAKGFDTFSIFGPVIDTDVDPMTLTVESFINGVKHQDYPVEDLVLNPFEIVASISQTMTLEPGDVIACGTSLGADPIQIGDTVEIRIAGIGSLVNTVA